MRSRSGIVDVRTGEVEQLPGTAALFLRLVGPVADAGLLREDQSIWARDHIELSFDAVIERATYPGILVGEVPVNSWAMQRRLRFLCNCIRLLLSLLSLEITETLDRTK